MTTLLSAAMLIAASMFSPRIIHSGEAFDKFSDGYLDQVKAYGFDSIMFYVWNADEPRASELNDLIARAKARGISSYLYSRVNTQAFVHPDDPKAEEIFENTYGKLARTFKDAKGILFVGESLEFPSKDERTCGLAIDYATDRRPEGDRRPYVGWFPCRDYPKLVSAIKKVMTRYNPELEVILWSYNWGYCDKEPRLELIRNWPKDVALLVTYEMFESYTLPNGLASRVADYSIAFVGPGKYFLSEAEEAKKCGVKLYAMCNTAARTWDLGMVPYLPIPYQWKKRWDGLKEAKEKYGLSGLVEGHHFGWVPNFVSELCNEAFKEGGKPFEQHIREIAERDFGAANADDVLAVWKDWSDAFALTKPSSENQEGPFRYGPAYPFNPLRRDMRWDDFSISPMFIDLNYRGRANSQNNTDANLTLECELLEKVIASFMNGAKRFYAIGTEKALEQARLGEFIARCYITTINAKRGLMAERAKDEKKVMELARAEYENVKATLPLVKADARLGFEPRLGHRCDERALKMKMKFIEREYFGGAVTEAVPYPEMTLSLNGDVLSVKNESNRDFESGGLSIKAFDAEGKCIGNWRTTSPFIAQGTTGEVKLPFDNKAIKGLKKLKFTFEQFEYGMILEREIHMPIEAEVKDYGGVPVVWIDGKPDTGLMFWRVAPKKRDAQVFGSAGIHLYTLMIAPSSEQRFDDMVAEILDADPKTKIIVRIAQRLPFEREKAMVDERTKAYNLISKQYEFEAWPSPGSDKWVKVLSERLQGIVHRIEEKWGHVVIGYHPGMGSCLENMYSWNDAISDYCDAIVKKYNGEAPDPSVYLQANPFDLRRLLDPAKERNAIEFQKFQSREMAKGVCAISKAVKEELARMGRKKLCGAFYGYLSHGANSSSVLSTGHHDHEQVLRCKDIDFISAPIDYSSRQLGGTPFAQCIPASIELAGKVYWAEEDTRFHLATGCADRVSSNITETRNVLLRNFFDIWSHGGSIWWMDLFNADWYDSDEFIGPLEECSTFARDMASKRESVAEIAVFINERSIPYERMAPVPISNELIPGMMPEIAACGAPHDVYRLGDIESLASKGRLSKYKLAIVLNAHSVDGDLRKMVKEELCKDGRTVIFMGPSGWNNEVGGNEDNVRDFTGFGTHSRRCRDSMKAEGLLDGHRIVFGSNTGSNPSLIIDDKEAKPLAWYVQATAKAMVEEGGGVAMAEKDFKDWKGVLVTINALPSEMIRKFAAEAGVHVYSEYGDVIYAGEGWFAVSAKFDGRHTLVGLDGQRYEVDLKRGETRLFQYK